MTGRNVLHTMGFDAFGLPAEQYAVQTGTHPRVTTEANIESYRAQFRRLGLAHDPRRSVATTDVEFYRWTQWIFLQIHGSWSTRRRTGRARSPSWRTSSPPGSVRCPTAGLVELSRPEQDRVLDGYRLAYLAEAPVNWCPALGTVLANEEVTAEGRSERGNFPVFRRRLRQWMMRITAYAERLADDLDGLDWPDSIKLMQRNWIGRSQGARPVPGPRTYPGSRRSIEVFTTRPDTLFGATYLVLAPEHPLVDEILPAAWPERSPARSSTAADRRGRDPPGGIAAYRSIVGSRSDLERQEARDKTGVFTGTWATNPVNGEPLPVFVADYVLMGYGTGAIMAVPARTSATGTSRPCSACRSSVPCSRPDFDGEASSAGRGDQLRERRDFPERPGRRRGEGRDHRLACRAGEARPSCSTSCVTGCSAASGTGASRSRSSTPPTASPTAARRCRGPCRTPTSRCCCPTSTTTPRSRSPPTTATPHRSRRWPAPRSGRVLRDLASDGSAPGRGTSARPTRCRSGRAPAGTTCATSTRRTPSASSTPTSSGSGWVRAPSSSARATPVVSTCTSAASSTRCCTSLRAVLAQGALRPRPRVRSEPFRRLFNQGYIQAGAYTDARGVYVPAEEVVESADGPFTRNGVRGHPGVREDGQVAEELGDAR